MIRLIILFAIFLAVYPMIGDGWEAFSSDFGIESVGSIISHIIAGLSNIVDTIQGH